MTAVQRNTWFWVAGFLLFFLGLWLLSAILLPFVAGIAIAYFLDPLVNRLAQLRMPRGLAAFVVLTLVLTTVFQIFSAGLGRASDLDDYAHALVIAQSRLAAAGIEEQLKEGETRGESEDRRYRWVLAVQRAPQQRDDGSPAQAAFDLFRVAVLVEWQGVDARARSLDLATMMLGPKT